eukprot:scaffold1790_cov257-Pinguiococcus_pyrenoidosus.AAC.52
MSSEALLENPALFAGNMRRLSLQTAREMEAQQKHRDSALCAKDTRLEPKACAQCGKVGVQTFSCTKCNEVFYCNRKCSSRHWKTSHRDTCLRLRSKKRQREESVAEAKDVLLGGDPDGEDSAQGPRKRKREEYLHLSEEIQTAPIAGPGVGVEEGGDLQSKRVSQDDLAEEYLDAVEAFPGASTSIVKGHMFSICFAGLHDHPDLRQKMGAAGTLAQYRQVLRELRGRRSSPSEACKVAWYRRHRLGTKPKVEAAAAGEESAEATSSGQESKQCSIRAGSSGGGVQDRQAAAQPK